MIPIAQLAKGKSLNLSKLQYHTAHSSRSEIRTYM